MAEERGFVVEGQKERGRLNVLLYICRSLFTALPFLVPTCTLLAPLLVCLGTGPSGTRLLFSRSRVF